MNWKTFKTKYPAIWDSVYNGMIIDLLDCMSGVDIEQYKNNGTNSRIERIAHNAAFLACNAIHKKQEQIKRAKPCSSGVYFIDDDGPGKVDDKRKGLDEL